MSEQATRERYYVTLDRDRQARLTTLTPDGEGMVTHYPLPILPPGLTEQLEEWYQWREVLGAALSTAVDPEHETALADLLGEAFLRRSNDS